TRESCQFCRRLPGVMEEVSWKCPGVEVKIDAEATHRPIQALLQGKLDLGIVSEVRRDKQLQYRALFEDEFVAVMSADHPLVARPYLTSRDFSDQNLILFIAPEGSTRFTKMLS